MKKWKQRSNHERYEEMKTVLLTETERYICLYNGENLDVSSELGTGFLAVHASRSYELLSPSPTGMIVCIVVRRRVISSVLNVISASLWIMLLVRRVAIDRREIASA